MTTSLLARNGLFVSRSFRLQRLTAWIVSAAVAAIACGAQPTSAADAVPEWNGKPVVAYARLAPLDHLRRDLAFLTEGAGRQATTAVGDLIAELAEGVDPARPAGMAVMIDDTLVPVVFLPLKDEGRLFTMFHQRFGWEFNLGEDGLYRGLTVRAVARVVGSWLYITGPDHRERLANLPTDPDKLFAGSDPGVAAQLNVAAEQMPVELRRAFAQQIVEFLGDGDPGLMSAIAQQALSRMVTESKSWQVELQCFRPLEQFHITARVTPAEGSELRRWVGAAERRPVLMEHLATNDSTASIVVSAALENDALDTLTTAWNEIDAAARAKLPSARSNDPLERRLAQLATTGLDAVSATIARGEFDAGLVVHRQGNELVLLAGSNLVGSRKVSESALAALESLQQVPDFQSLQWATGANGDVTFHEFQVPADANTRPWVGDAVHLTVAFGPERVYVAAGGVSAMEKLSLAIDHSRNDAPSQGDVLRIALRMAPFLALLDEAPGSSAEAKANVHQYAELIAPYRKNDALEFNLTAADEALEARLRIDMGVVRMLAAAVPTGRTTPPPATVVGTTPGTPPPTSPGNLNLALRLPPGSRFQLRFDTDSDVTTTIDDNDRIDRGQYSTVYDFRVLEARRDGSVRLEASLAHAAIKKTSPDGAETFDSAKPPAPEKMTMEMLLYASMVGEAFQVTLGPDGSLTDFAGIPEAVDRIVDNKLQPSAADRPRAKAFIEQGFNENGLRDSLGRAFEFYPGKPATEGDRWTRTNENFSGINFLLDSRYQLRSLTANEATITVRSQIREKEAAAAPIRWEVLGNQTGTIAVDPRNGRLLRAEYELKTDAEATLTMDGKEVVRPVKSTIKMTIGPADGDDGRADVRPAGDRTYWRHATGHFADHGAGDWAERSQNGSFELKEVERTSEHIELVSKSGTGTRVRLFAGRSEVLRNGRGSWGPQYNGDWAAPQSAEQRVFWRHPQGFFDNVDGDKWLERSPNGAFYFVEAARTDDYVELRNTQTGTAVRLFENRCELKGSQQREFQPRYQGGWEAR